MRIVLFLFVGYFLTGINLVNAQTVYVTNTGEKYHTESCHYLKQSKKAIVLEKAKKLNYTACKVCKPSNTKGVSTEKNTTTLTEHSSNNSTKKAVATRCTGTTKAGSRCNRKTTNANGRCYQH